MTEFDDLKVLIVDDEKATRLLVREMLTEFDIPDICEFADGREALSYLEACGGAVDIIICDWNMPAISGIDFFRKVRVFYPRIAFLIATGRADTETVMEAKEAGVDAMICKPFHSKQLEAKMRILLKKSMLHCA